MNWLRKSSDIRHHGNKCVDRSTQTDVMFAHESELRIQELNRDIDTCEHKRLEWECELYKLDRLKRGLGGQPPKDILDQEREARVQYDYCLKKLREFEAELDRLQANI